MRVPDVVLQSVGFICETTHKSATSIEGEPYATGFFVRLPSAIFGKSFHCFVTAKHVAKELANREIHFQVNKRGGGITSVRDVYGQWFLHPTDKTADVAVIPFTPHPEMDMVSVPSTMFVTGEFMRAHNLGIGDEVFMTGLFQPAQADTRNLPIVRHGNIAMIPDRQIQTDFGYADVYLIEARSIGGISGSPVFVRQTVSMGAKADEDGTETGIMGIGPFYLLGLMHGHWDIKESDINKPIVEHDRKHGVNMGIAIVVPAQKILETINSPKLMEIHKQMEDRERKKSIPGMDADTKSKEQSHGLTRTEFESALKKATRKIERKR
jgi:hypothetical protein